MDREARAALIEIQAKSACAPLLSGNDCRKALAVIYKTANALLRQQSTKQQKPYSR